MLHILKSANDGPDHYQGVYRMLSNLTKLVYVLSFLISSLVLASESSFFPIHGEFEGVGSWAEGAAIENPQQGQQRLLVRLQPNEQLLRVELLIMPDGYKKSIRNFHVLRVVDGSSPVQKTFEIDVVKDLVKVGNGQCSYDESNNLTCKYSFGKPAWIKTKKGLASGMDTYEAQIVFSGQQGKAQLVQSGGQYLTYLNEEGKEERMVMKEWQTPLKQTSDFAWVDETPMLMKVQNEIVKKLEVCLTPKKTSVIPKEYMFEAGFFCDSFSSPAPQLADKDLRDPSRRVVNFADKGPQSADYSHPATPERLQRLEEISLKLKDAGYDVRFLIAPDIIGLSSLNTDILVEYNQDQASHYAWGTGDDEYIGDGQRSPAPTRNPGFMLISFAFSSSMTGEMQKEIDRVFGSDYEIVSELLEVVNESDRKFVLKIFKTRKNRHMVRVNDMGLQGSLYEKLFQLGIDSNDEAKMAELPIELRKTLRDHQVQYLTRKKALNKSLGSVVKSVEAMFSENKIDEGINYFEKQLVKILNENMAGFEKFKQIPVAL